MLAVSKTDEKTLDSFKIMLQRDQMVLILVLKTVINDRHWFVIVLCCEKAAGGKSPSLAKSV